jgi:AcrR family transcriptional regulator
VAPMPRPVKRRTYTSPLRAEQAAATRARIIDVARTLFTSQGYPGTTLVQVGAAAGVATDTVLHVFGSKKALLAAVLDVVVGGDSEQVAVLDRQGPQALRQEKSQRRQVAMLAVGLTGQLERIRPMDDILRSAAATDADARSLREDLQLRQRRAAMTAIASWIAANGDLRDHMSVDHAAAIIWTLTSPEVHQMLCDHWGWDSDQFRSWLATTLESSLLEPLPPH